MQKLHQHFQTRVTPQGEAIPGREMVENSAGGQVFAVDDWKRMARFLILGTEGGTYYASEKELTKGCAEATRRCIAADGARAISLIVDISHGGKAAKNDPALYALAMAAADPNVETRRTALAALPRVARIGTHLFHFNEYVEAFRGRGRALNKAVRAWYADKPVEDLAFQCLKYQQRDGWSHRDLLRLTKGTKTTDASRDALYGWIAGKKPIPTDIPLMQGYAKLLECTSDKVAAAVIGEFNLPRECVPTERLNSPEVWAALLESMPLTAMIRNLGKMSAVGLLKPLSEAAVTICDRITNGEALRNARVHPIAILAALLTYKSSQGVRGSLEWEPVTTVIDALAEVFYASFEHVEPTGKRTMLALDVSGSMGGGQVGGVPGLTPRVASAALAMVTARVEKNYFVVAFTSSGGSTQWRGNDGISALPISPRQRLDDIVRSVSGLPFGGTDCALPFLYALEQGLEVDSFVVYTDNETWAGAIHPVQALQQYRQKTGIAAKSVVVGMTSTGFTLADPTDPGMLDVVGMSTDTPAAISEFLRD